MRLPVISSYRDRIKSQKGEIDSLTGKIKQLSHFIDILSADATVSSSHKGNAYTTYSSQVQQLSKMYDGTADWGNQIVANIIDSRTAFIVGNGVKLKYHGDSPGPPQETKEWLFADTFARVNDLYKRRPIDLATEAEIEGSSLVRLICDNDVDIDVKGLSSKGMIRTVAVPYVKYNYKIVSHKLDPARFIGAEYSMPGTGSDVKLKEGEFVYARFTGRIVDCNKTPPRLGRIISTIEHIDQASRDWRLINELFAAPTPHFDCDTPAAAKDIDNKLDEINWVIGKRIVTAGVRFSLVEYSGEGSASLKDEITTKMKIVSGASGTPIHLLGWADVLSNRATADSIIEMLVTTTARDRTLWSNAFTDMLRKSVVLYNEAFDQNINPNDVSFVIPEITQAKIKEIIDIWLPMFLGGGLSLQALLSKVPDIDNIEQEIESIREGVEF